MNLMLLIVAGAAAILTFLVARPLLQHQLRIGPPNLLAALVSTLAFLGITSGGNGIVGLILLPYAALALTLLMLFLCIWLGRHIDFSRFPGRANRLCSRSKPKALQLARRRFSQLFRKTDGAQSLPDPNAHQTPNSTTRDDRGS